MKEWWHKKKAKMRKNQKNNGEYTFWDFLFDVLVWLPELILLPFRIIFWLIRGLIRNPFDL
ncbi:hypothetical protein [Gracilibacillus suaedae]|uniref:hypothetical protein n=1 Tax=Gracilibacillus suaedae TaxID=2820273 RepID=UPI001ABE26AD|nr:hypothetical protein [Gracilibacillus suaedae]